MLPEEDLKTVYNWVDEFQLSRPKRNISRDFSDAVLVAEIVYHYFPNLVELHNYAAVNSVPKKEYNWKTLHNKVLKSVGVHMTEKEIKAIASSEPEAIEEFLLKLKEKLEFVAENRSPAMARATSAMRNSKGIGSKSSTQKSQPAGAKGKFKVIGNDDQAKNEVIEELKETIQHKVDKMELLVKIKDEKLEKLQNKLAAHGHPLN